MNTGKLKANLLLVLTAFIWGCGFIAQSVGMEYIGPFTFNGIRMIIGGTVLLPVILVRAKVKKSSGKDSGELPFKKVLPRGLLLGVILAIAASFQQVGIIYTSAGKAGFITALYVIIVPIAGILFGRKPTLLLTASALLAVVGMYFLCLSESLTLGRGDTLVLICAVFYAIQILVVDKLSPNTDGVLLSCIQFYTAGILCLIVMAFTEQPDWSMIKAAAAPILYAGVLSCGVGYTLQIIGQKGTSPVMASLLMSLESVFAVIMAWILLGDKMSGREIAGCCIVFAAIILAQLPSPKELKAGMKGHNGSGS